MGAKKVADAGFSGGGEVLSLILSDGRRHLAEKQFDAMLEELHITDIEKLSVEANMWAWNLKMLGVSVVAALASLTPYIYLFKVRGEPLSIRWLLPLARSVGGLLVANLMQLVIQARLLEIIRHRMVFLTLKDVVCAIPPAHLPNGWNTQWDDSVASEVALYHLKAHLRKQVHKEKGDVSRSAEDLESQTSSTAEKQAQAKKNTELCDAMDHLLFTATKTHGLMMILAQIGVLLGLGFSVLGYIGSFSLVQGATTSTHALIWLVMEVALSLIRIGLWSWNPNGDDITLNFTLKLIEGSPLPTCNIFSEKLDEEKVIPLTRSWEFLGEITSSVGVLEPFEGIQEGVALYYTMTFCKATNMRVLYVTMHDYKEGLWSTLVHRSDSAKMIFYDTKMQVQDGRDGVRRLQALLGNQVSMQDNYLSGDQTGTRIKEHCQYIFNKLSQNNSAGSASGKIERTWSLKKLSQTKETKKWTLLEILKRYCSMFYWHQVPSSTTPSISASSTIDEASPADLAYFQVGKLEHLRQQFCLVRGQWITEYISLVTKETLEGLPQILPDLDKENNQSSLVLCEAAFADYTILYEWKNLERLHIYETAHMETILLSRSKVMIELLKGRGASTAQRISAEWTNNLDCWISVQERKSHERCMSLAEAARNRIKQREYDISTQIGLNRYIGDTEEKIKETRDYLMLYIKELELLPNLKSELGQQLEDFSQLREFNAYPEITVMDLYKRVTRVNEWGPQETKQQTKDEFKEMTARVGRQQQLANKRLSDERDMIDERLGRLQAELALMEQAHQLNGFEQALDPMNDAEFIHECKEFQASPFLAHLALGENARYIWFSPNDLRQNSVANITQALQRNSIVSYISCRDCSPACALEIISSLEKAKNITVILPQITSSHLPVTPENNLVEALRQLLKKQPNIVSIIPHTEDDQDALGECQIIIQRNRDHILNMDTSDGLSMLVFYECADIANWDLHFTNIGKSRCVVQFSLSPAKRSACKDTRRGLKLRLNHYQVGRGEVEIYLDEKQIQWDLKACPRDSFGVQDINLDLPDAEDGNSPTHVHELTITLSKGEGWSPYCLRDVQLLWSSGTIAEASETHSISEE